MGTLIDQKQKPRASHHTGHENIISAFIMLLLLIRNSECKRIVHIYVVPQFLIHCLILHSTQSLELSKVEERLYQDKYNKCHCSLQPQENNEWMYYFWKKQFRIKFVLATLLLGNSFNFLSTVCITIWGKLWTSTLICRAKKYLMIPNNSYPLVVVTINTKLRFPANK